MLNYIKKSIQISGISAILLGTTILNISPAQAVDVSQGLGESLTWQCSLSSAMKSNRDKASQDKSLPCETNQERAAKLSTAAASQLIQQGVQLFQLAQPLLQQFLPPLSSSALQTAQQAPLPVKQ
jgi:hypothetical protein